MDLRVTFLNCNNLFTPTAANKRGPNDGASYTAKVDGLARLLKDVHQPALPDLCGLCEIGNATAAKDLLNGLAQGTYDLHWQKRPPRRGETGEPTTAICIGFNPQLLAVERVLPSEHAVPSSRYHWLAAQMRVRSNNLLFWFVVNHWPSDFNYGQQRATWPRAQIAAAIGEMAVRECAKETDRMLLIGDFNCEPFDPAITGSLTAWPDRLIGARERSRATNLRNRLPHFYNPMWRHLGELHAADLPGALDRPPGTFRSGDEWRCLDQLLVSPALLAGAEMTFRESSLRIVLPRFGGSDHCAVGATFGYN